MTDRWDLASLGHRRYDEWLSDVGPQPNQEHYRCGRCGVALSIQRAVRHTVCDDPACEHWLADARVKLQQRIEANRALMKETA